MDAGATVMIHTIRGVGYMLTELKQTSSESDERPLRSPS
jgi:hypothetical protein